MSIESVVTIDLSAWDEPEPDLEPHLLLEAWLGYQRHEFLRKLRDLTPEQVVEWSVPPVKLSVLGLVRHMTQMEHAYVSWGLSGGERVHRYGEEDYAGGSVDTIDDDISWYFEELALADEAITALHTLDSLGKGHGRSLRATLVKMIDEYAIHAGQAHMLRFAALGEILR